MCTAYRYAASEGKSAAAITTWVPTGHTGVECTKKAYEARYAGYAGRGWMAYADAGYAGKGCMAYGD